MGPDFEDTYIYTKIERGGGLGVIKTLPKITTEEATLWNLDDQVKTGV